MADKFELGQRVVVLSTGQVGRVRYLRNAKVTGRRMYSVAVDKPGKNRQWFFLYEEELEAYNEHDGEH